MDLASESVRDVRVPAQPPVHSRMVCLCWVPVSFMGRHRATTVVAPRVVKRTKEVQVVRAWSKATSVFAPYVSDTARSVAQCFDNDWSLTKVGQLLCYRLSKLHLRHHCCPTDSEVCEEL